MQPQMQPMQPQMQPMQPQMHPMQPQMQPMQPQMQPMQPQMQPMQPMQPQMQPQMQPHMQSMQPMQPAVDTPVNQPPPTFKKMSGRNRSPAAERLGRIQSRINAVQDQLIQAQSLPQGGGKMHELLTQMEALLSVKSILTGTSSQPAAMQPLRNNPPPARAAASGPARAAASGPARAAPSGPARAQPSGPAQGPAPTQHEWAPPAPQQNFRMPSGPMPKGLPAGVTSAAYQIAAAMFPGLETTTWGALKSGASSAKKPAPYTSGGGRFLGLGAKPSAKKLQSQLILNRKRKSSRWAKNQARASSLSMSGFNTGTNQIKANMNILSPKEMDALIKANGEPTPASNGTKSPPPKEGDIRTLGKKEYVFRDVDGYETFQWLINTPPPMTQTQTQTMAVSSPSPVVPELTTTQAPTPMRKKMPRRRRRFLPRNARRTRKFV